VDIWHYREGVFNNGDLVSGCDFEVPVADVTSHDTPPTPNTKNAGARTRPFQKENDKKSTVYHPLPKSPPAVMDSTDGTNFFRVGSSQVDATHHEPPTTNQPPNKASPDNFRLDTDLYTQCFLPKRPFRVVDYLTAILLFLLPLGTYELGKCANRLDKTKQTGHDTITDITTIPNQESRALFLPTFRRADKELEELRANRSDERKAATSQLRPPPPRILSR
jgi:hypothetical protein